MNKRLINEGFNNYYIIDMETEFKENYEVNMLLQNRFEYLLEFGLKLVDGNTVYEYKISGYQPLSRMLKTKKLNIENPFVIFGIGIKPNVKPFEEFIDIDKGILVNEYMQSSDENIYAIGECAQVEKLDFIAGHVKECTTQSNVAISHILQDDIKKYDLEVTVDMLKVKGFELVEISSPSFF